MGNSEYPAAHTSNDLLFDLDPGRSRTALNYEIVAQSAEEVQDIQHAPAISMGQYLIESDQVKLLTTISIYTQHGESRDQVRLLLHERCCTSYMESDGKAAKAYRVPSSPT